MASAALFEQDSGWSFGGGYVVSAKRERAVGTLLPWCLGKHEKQSGPESMKIAIVYDVMYPFELGGGEKRNWEVAVRLARQGHEVQLVSIKMWDGPAEFVKDGVRCVGVCPLKPGLSVGGKRSFWQPLYFAVNLFAYLRRCDVDLIDCSNFPYLSCLAARAATMFRKTRLVVTWYEARGRLRWMEHRGPAIGVIAWLFELWISRLTSFNVSISHLTEGNARNFLGLKQMRVVPCGVDSGAISALSAGVIKEDQVLYVGRLTRYKRVDVLMEAFARIAGGFPDHKLKIVGRGYERANLEALAERLGISGKTVFCEGLSEKDLYLEYSKSQVFVLPSEQEGFGIVIIEAMAAGTPVIALKARHSAADGLITHGSDGFLVANAGEMAEALERLLADAALRNKLAAAGRETARKYDWDGAVVPEVENYYRQVVGC